VTEAVFAFGFNSRFRVDNLLFIRQMLLPFELYRPTATRCLSCCVIFWTTQYNTPRSFHLASYSEVLHDPRRGWCLAVNRSHCVQALGRETSDRNTTLSRTGWLVGFVMRSAPPATLHWLTFPAWAGV